MCYTSKQRLLGTKGSLTGASPCNPSPPDAAILTFGGTVMTKREIEIKVRLNQKEAEAPEPSGGEMPPVP